MEVINAQDAGVQQLLQDVNWTQPVASLPATSGSRSSFALYLPDYIQAALDDRGWDKQSIRVSDDPHHPGPSTPPNTPVTLPGPSGINNPWTTTTHNTPSPQPGPSNVNNTTSPQPGPNNVNNTPSPQPGPSNVNNTPSPQPKGLRKRRTPSPNQGPSREKKPRERLSDSSSSDTGNTSDDSEVPNDKFENVENKPYTFEKRVEKEYMSYKAKDRTYEVKFNDEWRGSKLIQLYFALFYMFQDVLRNAKANLAGNDLGRVVIHHDGLNNPIVVPLVPLDLLDANRIMDRIEEVLNSNETLELDDSFRIDIGTIELPKGGAKLFINCLMGEDSSINRKRSIVTIVNEGDTLCLARSVAVCWAKLNQVSTEEWNRLTTGMRGSTTDLILNIRKVPSWYYQKMLEKKRSNQKDLATKLSNLAGVAIDRPASLNDIPAFENVIDVDILVISARKGNKFLRVPSTDEGEQPATRPKLYLYFLDGRGDEVGHFHAITKITGFFKSSYFCETCLKPFNDKHKHNCTNYCRVCKTKDCKVTETMLSCRHCHMVCRSVECFTRHLEKKPSKKVKKGEKIRPLMSQCDIWWKCRTCKQTIDRTKRKPTEHRCGEWFCYTCQNYFVDDHQCFHRAKKPTNTGNFRYIFFDFECSQDTMIECEKGHTRDAHKRCGECRDADNQCSHCSVCINCNESICGSDEHKPNYVVAQTACHECQDKPVEEKCNNCGNRCNNCKMTRKKKYLKPP